MTNISNEKLKEYLDCYYCLEDMIKDRTEQLMNEGNVSYYEWSTTNKDLNDIIDEIDNDLIIKKCKYIKQVMDEFVLNLKEYKIEYCYFQYKYIKRINHTKLKEKFKRYDINKIENKIIKLLKEVFNDKND